MPLDPKARRLLDMLALGAGARGSGPMTAAERRSGFKALMAMSRAAKASVAISQQSVAGPAGPLRVRVYGAETDQGAAPGLVFFHGGGLVAGDLDTHDGLCRRLAAESSGRILAVDYRLAPEHPFPAAFEDAVAATAAILDRSEAFGLDPARIAVGGDSAGGGLAAAAAGALGSRLRFQLLLCPVLDLAERRPSRVAFGAGYMLDQAVMDRDLADLLPGGGDPADPRLSPVRAPLTGLPPTIIHTAEFDPLRDEGADYAAALQRAGVAVSLTCHPGMIHHFLGLEGVLPAAREALAAIGAEMREAFARR